MPHIIAAVYSFVNNIRRNAAAGASPTFSFMVVGAVGVNSSENKYIVGADLCICPLPTLGEHIGSPLPN